MEKDCYGKIAKTRETDPQTDRQTIDFNLFTITCNHK